MTNTANTTDAGVGPTTGVEEWLTGGPSPPTTEPIQPVPTSGPAPGPDLPPGVHPLDQSVPLVPGRSIDYPDKVAGEGSLPPQGQRTKAPWSTENEEAVPVYQRAAHDWTANAYTLNTNLPVIQLVGRLRGAMATKVWVPSTATAGVVISPDEGDVNQGAGVQLNPGDSISIESEAAVWAGLIQGQTTATVSYVRLYNPPGGGLGLSSV